MRSLSESDQLVTNDLLAQSRFHAVRGNIVTEISTIDSAIRQAEGFLEPLGMNPKLRKNLVDPATEKIDQIRQLVKEIKSLLDSQRKDDYHAY